MRSDRVLLGGLCSLALAVVGLPAWAEDDDALNLTPAAADAQTASRAAVAGAGLSAVLELAALAGLERSGRSEHGHRLAWDVKGSHALNSGWRLEISNRLENQEPSQAPRPQTRNHLRELYLSWRDEDGGRALEWGRINVRHGSAYGYNPTDYFRHGATQSLVSVDPIALRRNRSGAVMLRGSQQWGAGGLEITVAPRLSDGGQDNRPLSLGLNGTNASDRLLIAAQWRPSQRWNGEVLALGESGRAPRWGLNFSGLLQDSIVAHAEWSAGRMPSLLDQVSGVLSMARTQQQASAGLTYSLPGGMTLTAEVAFNSAGLRSGDWPALFARGATTVARLFERTQADQELATRQAWLLYLAQPRFGLKQLDLAAFVRQNRQDNSRLTWMELRYHWPRVDAAIQWHRASGPSLSEFGALQVKELVQLVTYYYF